MSLLRTLDRTSAVSNTYSTHRPLLLTFLCPAIYDKATTRGFGNTARTKPPHVTRTAASCPVRGKQISTQPEGDAASPKPTETRRKRWLWDAKRKDKVRLLGRGPLERVKKFARSELQALVDYYGMELDKRPDSEVEDDGKLVWNVGDDHEPWPLRDPADAAHIKKLEKLLQDDEAPHDDVFETYKKLQSPGVVYLRAATIRNLLHHLSIVERPTPIAMQRFLSILDDMKTAHIHILRSEWTSAIHLAGRAMGKVSADQVQSALHLWRDMEFRAGIRGGYVTFNVLFNIAVKAEKYTLAETFMTEMQARNIAMHRHYRVSLLYYYGVMQNGNAVRKTYSALVAAGDIVDTVVMNAVIASLFRAGEPQAAEHVFERMKRLHATKTVSAPGHQFYNRNWRDRRVLGQHFRDESRRLKEGGKDEELKQLQDYAPIAPDPRTYGLLIRHHATVAGNLDKVNQLLQEMTWNSVSVDGTVFIVIFQGFNAFGGVRYTSWTASKLERIWQQYLKALDQDLERTWISSLAVIVALRAFARCAGTHRTLQVWDQIRRKWEGPSEHELEAVLKVLRRLVPSQLEEVQPQHGGGFFDGRWPS
ncbi:hypothetical protein BDW02DRAFT_91528 [Decorospora gaudefroyi]|uniref:Pentatricopeptide repeat protein n=1 Tax=Decorospora gaudefroyi TaxID=184978 RepID=A0A6A5K1N2_9PLEO|nr:hypothetical protein BDW02DRAFT_91528 [Decorospora gaudefroyi]